MRQYYSLIIFFILIRVLHLIMGFLGDDVKFAKVLPKYSILDFMVLRYNTWSSRVIIESLLIVLTRQNILLWKIMDTVLYTIGVYLVIRFVNPNNDKNITLLGVLLFMMYPFFVMAGAGWLATTLNYSWCFVFGMISFIPIINKLNGKSTSKIVYIISFLCLIYAINQEQCCLIFGFNVLYLIYCLIRKQEISKFNILVLIASVISLIMILTCEF